MSKQIVWISIVLFVISGCSIDTELDQGDEMELNPIVGKWQFRELYINDFREYHIGWGFEGNTSSYFVPYFWIEYNSDFTYEFRTDILHNPYGLGANFQPDYGTWDFNEVGQLVHNPGMSYEVVYNIIQMDDSTFIREHDRIVEWQPDTIPDFRGLVNPINIGDIVTYREVLKIRTVPCCEFD